MLKYITLACALLGLLAAVSLESWLRKGIVRTDETADAYATVRSRNLEFWSIQPLPMAPMLLVVGAAIGVGVGIPNAVVFLCGAILCLASVGIGSRTVITGSIAPASHARGSDIRGSLRSAYRSASVMGLSNSSVALIGIGLLFLVLDDTSKVIDLIASFGLGASVTSLCLGLSGTAYSGAYALSVKSDDYTDYSGSSIGSGADLVETYLLSVCAAALLSEVAVDTSGVTSTFNVSAAARYPLIVFAAGIVASIIGVFVYRGHVAKDPAAGITAGNYIAAALTAAVAVVFSYFVLESYIYGVCVASGMAAALISGEISRNYSSDGRFFKKYVPSIKSIGASQSMIYSLSIGMISVAFPAALIGIATIISYYYANYYGIALSAVGISSIAAVNSAVRGFSINTASASEIVSVNESDVEGPTPADVLLTASVRTDVIGKTYSAVSTSATLVAMYCALSVVGSSESADLLTTSAFYGMMLGAVSVFAAGGLIIRSIRLTSVVLRDKLDDIYNDEKNISFLRGQVPVYLLSVLAPFAAGFGGGVNSLIAFACSTAVTGMCVLFAFNDSGKYFDRMATETIGTVIKIMVAFTLVFAPFFTSFGGIF